MRVREIQARSILRRQRGVDSWFLCRAGMNLYRGCSHDCAYCDGRAESYRVEGTFGEEVAAKTNAVELLDAELGRPRVSWSGFLMLGGGVGDSYQPAEAERALARGALALAARRGLPVHVLTKSTLVLRDADLLEEIGRRSAVTVSFSLSTVDAELASTFEPGVPSPAERLAALANLRERGVHGGIFLMPVLPYLSDGEEAIRASVAASVEAGAEYVVFAGMTLKRGRQEEHFLRVLAGRRPDLVDRYRRLYPGDRWGRAAGDYYAGIERLFAGVALERGIAPRIPRRVFVGVLSEDDLVQVMLEHVDYALRLRGAASSFGRAARAMRAAGRPARELAQSLFPFAGADGVAPQAREAIREILDRGTCRLYDELYPGYTRPMQTVITHEEARSAFETIVDGHRCEMHYTRLDPSTVAFDHTYVHPDQRGRGVAADLVATGLAWARQKKLRVVPSCSYVAAFMAKHREWDDLRAGDGGHPALGKG